MVAVDGMQEYIGKGSQGSTITNIIQFLPIDMFAAVLAQLYEAREIAKANLYEISGISDIVLGQLQNTYEKLGQSRIKGEFATQRISTKRRAIDRCIRDTLRLKAEVMIEHFGEKTLRADVGLRPAARHHAGLVAGAAGRRAAGVGHSARRRGGRQDLDAMRRDAAKTSASAGSASTSRPIRPSRPTRPTRPSAGSRSSSPPAIFSNARSRWCRRCRNSRRSSVT